MLVLATIGVWENLSNDLVGKIVHTFYDSMSAEAAANAVL